MQDYRQKFMIVINLRSQLTDRKLVFEVLNSVSVLSMSNSNHFYCISNEFSSTINIWCLKNPSLDIEKFVNSCVYLPKQYNTKKKKWAGKILKKKHEN